jgi:diguanylate cyclase (GGDEF)-like protein
MRISHWVERGRDPGTGLVAENRHGLPDMHHPALVADQPETDSLAPPSLSDRGSASGDPTHVPLVAVPPPPQPRPSALPRSSTSIIVGSTVLFGLYLLWKLTGFGARAHASVIAELFFVVAGLFVVYSTISGRRALQGERARSQDLQAELGHQAFHDSLTGLSNRTLFRERLEHALSRRRGPFMVHGVLVIDLNGFKSINDLLGREGGDEILRVVADRLRGAVRRGDTVARFGADEFAILVEDVKGEDSVRAVVEHLLEVIRQPLVIAERGLVLESSIGIAVTGVQPNSAEELLRFADTAMHEAKQRRQSHYFFFEPAMQIALAERVKLEADLRGAGRRGELRVVYQPIIDLTSQKTIAFEALVRWMHPVRGILEPADFLSLAEHGGLIHEIDTWVLYQACVEASRWQHKDSSFAPIGVHVNLSPLQLREPDLVETVLSALSLAGLEPRSLTLELLESSVVDDLELAHARLSELKQHGVRISVDDFGTGYSSLSHLRTLPIDELKIDKSFVAAMQSSPQARTLVHSLIQLGAALGIATVAEGIEDVAQLRHLQDEECLFGQGYLFSLPLDREELPRYLTGDRECVGTRPAGRTRT